MENICHSLDETLEELERSNFKLEDVFAFEKRHKINLNQNNAILSKPQRRKDNTRRLAIEIWRDHPEIRSKDMCKREDIIKMSGGDGNSPRTPSTIYGWIMNDDPNPRPVGRPPKSTSKN